MVCSSTPRSSPPSKGLFPADALPGYPSSGNGSASRRSLTPESLRTRSRHSNGVKETSLSVGTRSEGRSPTPDFATNERQIEIALSSGNGNANASESAPDTPENEMSSEQGSRDASSSAQQKTPSRSGKSRRSTMEPTPVKRQLRERHGTFRPYTKDRDDRRRQGQGRKPLAQEHMGGVKSSKAAKPASTKHEADNNTINIIAPQILSKGHARRPMASGGNCLGQDDMSRAEKVSRTTLYIGLDGSKYPAVPVYLGSCNTVEAFFDIAQNSWDISAEEIEIITVRFPWRDDRRTITVKKAIPDTFQKMQDEILEAPCWASDQPRRCEVEVQVHKKGGKP